jgi:hypothetical protein
MSDESTILLEIMRNRDAKEIIKHLIDNGASESEAIAEWQAMRQQVQDGADPEEVLWEVCLEPDLIFGLF